MGLAIVMLSGCTAFLMLIVSVIAVMKRNVLEGRGFWEDIYYDVPSGNLNRKLMRFMMVSFTCIWIKIQLRMGCSI